MKVDGKGGVIMSKVNKVVNVFFFFEKVIDAGESRLERVGIEETDRHVEEEGLF